MLKSFKSKLNGGFFGFWIKQWRTTILVLGLLVIIGLGAAITIPKESAPEIQLGMVVINTVYPGGNPKDIDQLITEKIEKKIKNLEGVKKINSSSLKNISNILVEIKDNTTTTIMSSKIRDAIAQLSFPENVETPVVTEIDLNRNQLFTLVLYAENPTMDSNYLREKAEKLKHTLEGKKDIDTIEIVGGNAYDIEVLIDKSKLESLNIPIFQLANILQGLNGNQSLGSHRIGNMNYDFRVEGEIKSLDELKTLMIPIGDERVIPLEQLANFKKVYKNQDSELLIGKSQVGFGKLAISLQFTKKAGSNILNASKSSKTIVEEALKQDEYQEIGHFLTLDLGEIISNDYANLAVNGLTTLFIVFLIVFLFVGGLESIIATLSIPLAFFVTFFVLKSLGLSMNFLTNFSLIICLGIAIDTATVIIQGASENIKLGFRPKYAALLSVKTYKNSLISGTATTVAVFIPMLTLPGIMGRFLAYIPTTIFITLIASLFISLTITPTLFFRFSKNKKTYTKNEENEALLSPSAQKLLEEERGNKTEKKDQDHQSFRDRIFGNLLDRYEKKLTPILSTSKSRIITILIPFVALLLTIVFVSPKLGFLMMPPQDSEYLNLTLTAKAGMTSKAFGNRIQKVDQILGEIPELLNYTNSIENHEATITLRILPREERTRDSFSIEEELNQRLAYLQKEGIRVETSIQQEGPSESAVIGIKITAENSSYLKELNNVVGDFKNFLSKVPGTKNVKSSSEESPGEFVFKLNKEKLALRGMTQREINPSLYFALNGINAGTVKGNYENHDIKLKYNDFNDQLSPDLVMNTEFPSKNGNILLGSVASYQIAPAISKITRDDGKITIQVEANLQKGAKAEPINAQLMEFAENYHFPKGINYQKGGETEDNSELLIAMLSAFIFAVICIFGILVLQFNSYTQPGIIMYSVIMGFLGATYGMLFTGNPYSMLFMIGFIALTGIVVNNAIILIDTANENMKGGDSRFEAMKKSAKSRLKPILSTTLTTVIGLVTLTSDAFFSPLAWTIIFGLTIATIMTLFVIPALYEDEKTIKYLITRFVIKPLLKLIIPAIGLGLIRAICTMLSIPLFSSEYAKAFSLAFLITSILFFNGYGYYANLKGESGFIQNILKLQLISTQGTKLNKKQLIKRELLKRGLLIFPIIIMIILQILGGMLHIPLLMTLGGMIGGIGYLVIILGNLYAIWTSENKQARRDKRSDTSMQQFGNIDGEN